MRSAAPELLDRISQPTNIGDQRTELVAQPLARDYSPTIWAYPLLRRGGQSGGYARDLHFPDYWDVTARSPRGAIVDADGARP
jgi:hypothetical protein